VNVRTDHTVIKNLTSYKTGSDSIFVTRTATGPIEIDGGTLSEFSSHGTAGDAIQTASLSDLQHVHIHDVSINFENPKNIKQGVIISAEPATGVIDIHDNYFNNSTGSTDYGNAISIKRGLDANIYRNHILGTWKSAVAHWSPTPDEVVTRLNIDSNTVHGSKFLYRGSAAFGSPTVTIVKNIFSGLNGIVVTGNGDTYAFNNSITLTGGASLTLSKGQALYISGNNYYGDHNNFYPQGPGFIQNFACGVKYATLAAYQVDCNGVDQDSTSIHTASEYTPRRPRIKRPNARRGSNAK
jgi:hypothetical protein